MMTDNNFSNEIEEKNDRVSPKRFSIGIPKMMKGERFLLRN